MVDVVKEVVEDRPVGILADHVHSAGDRAPGVEGVVRPPRIPVHVHEDVPLDPGVGAVQIQAVVARAIEHVVDELQDRARPLAAGEVNRARPSAPSAPVTTITFPSMMGLRTPGKGSVAYQEFFNRNATNFCMNCQSLEPKLPPPRLDGGSELRRTAEWSGIDKICRSSVSRFQNPFGTTGYQQKGRGICHGFAGSWFTACSA